MNPLAKSAEFFDAVARHPEFKVPARGLVVSQCWLVVGAVRVVRSGKEW